MASMEIPISFFFLLQFVIVSVTASTVIDCGASFCGGITYSPPIRFPFRMKSVQPPRCGFAGFDLSCNNESQAILTLPEAGDFSVESIDYENQRIRLNDPDHCLPRRLLNLSLSGSKFRPQIARNFTLLNCPADAMEDVVAEYPPGLMTVPCMSSANYTVVSLPSRFYSGSGQRRCEVVATVSVPVLWPFMADLDEAIELTWDAPDCGECVARGGICGYNSPSGSLEVGCSASLPGRGISRAAKYGLVLGVGIPGFLCIIGLACFAYGRIRVYGSRHQSVPNIDFSSLTGVQPVLLSVGLDGPTIASYPKTLLGESKRLLKPNDTTCSICLCEYQPKETLRTIPDCNHYFHMDCIDEWLSLNATCPLCRNSPEGLTSRATSSSVSGSLASSV